MGYFKDSGRNGCLARHFNVFCCSSSLSSVYLYLYPPGGVSRVHTSGRTWFLDSHCENVMFFGNIVLIISQEHHKTVAVKGVSHANQSTIYGTIIMRRVFVCLFDFCCFCCG